MILVRILGFIDLIASGTFLFMLFGYEVPIMLMLFCAGLLLCKGLFVLTGDVLSIIDLFSALVFLMSIFFDLSSVFIWIPAFFLLAKAMVSFVDFA